MTDEDPAARMRQDIEALIARLKPEDRQLIRSMSEAELIRLHHGYGTWLRNQFRQNEFGALFQSCSKKVTDEKKEMSFDAISNEAIREIWRRLRDDLI